MAIQYNKYEQKEGGFISLKKLIPNEGDMIRLKCVDGEIKDGNFGVKILELKVIWHNPDTGKNEEQLLNCDAPDEANEMAGSQIYRGVCDSNIQANDVFEITNAGRMNNKYKTTIYNITKDETQPAPVPAPVEEEVNIDNIPL